MKDWLMELCPEIAEWQAEIIAEQVRIRVEAEREACAKVCERAWDTLDAFKQAYPENWHEEDEQVLKDLLKADLKLSSVKLKWQGLTDEERKSIREWQRIQEELGPVWAPMMLYLYEAIEAKLKEKNG